MYVYILHLSKMFWGFCELFEFYFLEFLEFQLLELLIERSEENGGNIEINGCDELKRIIVDGSLHPADLKAVVISKINQFFDSIRMDFNAKTKLISEAFPSKKCGKK